MPDPMTPEEWQRLQAAAIEAVGDRELRPTPGGAAGRAAAEHDAAAALRVQIAGHEAAAKALTDAAMWERERGDE